MSLSFYPSHKPLEQIIIIIEQKRKNNGQSPGLRRKKTKHCFVKASGRPGMVGQVPSIRDDVWANALKGR
jgi:hypothetical protein